MAIARAILRKSPIIILDEATASVDVETERQIQNAISRIAGTRTILAIAHRLSTIRNADLILVIEDGRVAERGTHEELMAKKGYYYQMQLASPRGRRRAERGRRLRQLAEHWAYFLGEIPTALVKAFRKLL